jgi:hypothetical protein
MCDYSLAGVPNRLATVGDELITHRFQTGAIGMASVLEVVRSSRIEEARPKRRGIWAGLQDWLSGPRTNEGICAVCLAPGAVLQMTAIPESLRRRFALSAVEEVQFTQLSAEAYQYRDAIRFRNGRHLILQYLQEGVRFKVVSDGAESQLQNVESQERTQTVGTRRIPA